MEVATFDDFQMINLNEKMFSLLYFYSHTRFVSASSVFSNSVGLALFAATITAFVNHQYFI